MPGGSSSPAIGNWPIVPVAAGALAIAIFVVDTLTHVDVAVGVLYVAVVLIVVRSFEQRVVLLVAAGCMALAVLSYLLSREGPLSVTGSGQPRNRPRRDCNRNLPRFAQSVRGASVDRPVSTGH